MLLKNFRLVDRRRIADNSWLVIESGLVTDLGSSTRADGVDLHGLIVTPGFIDMHVHGAANHEFGHATVAEVLDISRAHLRHGTTTMVAGIGSDPQAEMISAARTIARLPQPITIDGIFYEGPFLSIERRGAHDPSHLRKPDPVAFDALLDAGDDHVRMLAIAPELPGALDVIRHAVKRGVTVAVGHTDASYEVARAAFDTGARVATHLFNGMRQIHHRDPGPVIAALEDQRVTCELITDGHHVSDTMIRYVFDTVGAGRIALITDAIEATSVGDGTYQHSTSTIVVKNGLAMLADGSSIAGSTLTMERAIQRVVRDIGVGLSDAVEAATMTPARTLGIADRVGTLAPGMTANLVVLDDALTIQAVIHRGAWARGEEFFVSTR